MGWRWKEISERKDIINTLIRKKMTKKDIFRKAEDSIGVLGIEILYNEFLNKKKSEFVNIHQSTKKRGKKRWKYIV